MTPAMGARQFLTNALAHPIGGRHPVSTLWRVARWQVESRLRPGLHDKPWIEDARLLVRRGMTGATGNLYFGLHEFADMAFVLHFLRPGDLLADIGANIGSYTILAAKCAGAQVAAFEPHPETAALLARNVEHNAIAGQVTIHCMALSDRNGAGALTEGLDTMNRVVDASEGGALQVPLRTLDSVIGDAEPAMLKIDVEGHEPEVLAGAAATLAKASLQAIEIETVAPATDALLRAAGFTEVFYDALARRLVNAPVGNPSNRLYVRDASFVARRVAEARRFAVAGVGV